MAVAAAEVVMGTAQKSLSKAFSRMAAGCASVECRQIDFKQRMGARIMGGGV